MGTATSVQRWIGRRRVLPPLPPPAACLVELLRKHLSDEAAVCLEAVLRRVENLLAHLRLRLLAGSVEGVDEAPDEFRALAGSEGARCAERNRDDHLFSHQTLPLFIRRASGGNGRAAGAVPGDPLVDGARVQDLSHQIDPLMHVAARSRDLLLALASRSRLEPEVDLVVQTIALRREPLLLSLENGQFLAQIVEACFVHAVLIGTSAAKSECASWCELLRVGGVRSWLSSGEHEPGRVWIAAIATMIPPTPASCGQDKLFECSACTQCGPPHDRSYG